MKRQDDATLRRRLRNTAEQKSQLQLKIGSWRTRSAIFWSFRLETAIESSPRLRGVFRLLMSCQTCIRTLRLKVKSEVYSWLEAAAIEVNHVWNYSNEISYKAACPFAGQRKWLSAFDLNNLTAGAVKYFERIGAATIQRVNAEFATRRKQYQRTRLRWRVSRGAKRSLGWIPFKPEQLKRKGKALRFSGKVIRVFEGKLLEGVSFKSGCFAQDSVGDWWLCLPVEVNVAQSVAPREEVGLDLGLKHTASTSDGDRLEAAYFYRDSEKQIAQLQRRGHKRQAKRQHRRVARRRKDALHKYSRSIVNKYQHIVIGDVSSQKLAKTRMAKSVLDAGWGMLKTQLQYKGQQAGRSVKIVSERNTTRTCSCCGALTGPKGLSMLVVSHHGTTGSRFRSAVDYAADRERTVAQSHIRMGAGDEERTIYRFGCPCGDDCGGGSGTGRRSAKPGDYPQSPRVRAAADRQIG
jgi:IS605 OrfB family transposase